MEHGTTNRMGFTVRVVKCAVTFTVHVSGLSWQETNLLCKESHTKRDAMVITHNLFRGMVSWSCR